MSVRERPLKVGERPGQGLRGRSGYESLNPRQRSGDRGCYSSVARSALLRSPYAYELVLVALPRRGGKRLS